MRVLVLIALCAAASASAQTPAEIRRGLGAYAHEPTLGALLRATRELAELDPRAPRRAARRARRGGWLPTLRLGARRGQERDLSSQFAEDETTRVSTDDDLTLEGSLTFRFDRAVYGADEVAWFREARSRTVQRQEREQMLVVAFFERRRLQLERDLRGRRDLETVLRIRELAALMDVLSGGAFSRIIRAP